MRILIACEFSGIVREAFTKLGHDVTSCDLLPSELPGKHYQGDVKDILNDGWDMMIAHPPCTYLSVAGLHWNNKVVGRSELTKEGFAFFMTLVNAPIEKIAIENPVGYVNTHYRKADQIINPFQFGHPERKRTCLWLKNLPLLKPTNIVEPEKPAFIDRSGKARYFVDKQPPSKDRWKIRSKTFQGIAEDRKSVV